ncbi:MAG: hypothetical protein GY751_19660 [Bacteroidetes bacterium]|jgi:hypothetical protein|nr:hypothetical protein [Bacteroidota bacterium]
MERQNTQPSIKSMLDVLSKAGALEKIVATAQKELEPAFKQYIAAASGGDLKEANDLQTGIKAGQAVKKGAEDAGGAAAQFLSKIPLGADLGALWAGTFDPDVDWKVKLLVLFAIGNLLAGNFGLPADLGDWWNDRIINVLNNLSINVLGLFKIHPFEWAEGLTRALLSPFAGLDDAALIMWAKRNAKGKMLKAKHYAKFEKWAGMPEGSMTPGKAKRAADKSPSAPHNMFAMTRKKQQESIMKKSEIMQIIREEVEVVLTNEEAVEMFDLDPAALLDEVLSEDDKWIQKAVPADDPDRGKFSAAAKKAGMSTCDYAKKIKNDPDATELQKDRAQFALNTGCKDK